jgi:hypothetical protein
VIWIVEAGDEARKRESLVIRAKTTKKAPTIATLDLACLVAISNPRE